ncbi:MAG: hypothetical protein AAGG01_02880 [Planctomycetota bacterium]
MTNPLPLVLLASAIAGGVGAVATTVLTPQNDASAATQQIVGHDEDVLAQLERMEQSYNVLLDRIETLEAGSELVPVGAPPTRVSAVAPESELKEAVKAEILAELSEGPAAVATPSLQRAVETVLERREEQQKLEREQKRAAEQEKRLEDRLAKLQTDLGLDQNQVDSMRTIYQDQDVKRDELRDEMRAMRDAGGSREEARAMWIDLRDATNEAIQGVLSPTQYEQYQESNNNDRGFGRGGDRGGNNRGGGGNNSGGGNNGGGRRGR